MEGVTCLNFFPAQLTRGSATAGRVQQPQKGIKMAPSPQHCIWFMYSLSYIHIYYIYVCPCELSQQAKAKLACRVPSEAHS